MSLLVSDLENALRAVFNSMSGNDRTFSDDFTVAVKAYAESSTVITTDAGTVSAGAFTGKGEGCVTVTASDCAGMVYAGTQAMLGTGNNAALAAAMAAGVAVMITNGTAETDVSGVCVSPSGASFTLSGSAEGVMTGVPAPMEAAFFSAFEAMTSMSEGNNDYMAAQCAQAIHDYLTNAVVTTEGKGVLSGSIGMGTIF
jgi:hypothetical protein